MRYTVWRMCSYVCTRYVYFSKITWPLEKEKKSKEQPPPQPTAQISGVHKRPAQSGVHTAQYTLVAAGIPAAWIRQYISSPSVGCGLLTALSVVSEAYVERWNLNEKNDACSKKLTQKRACCQQSIRRTKKRRECGLDRPRRCARAMHRLSR